MPKLSAYVNDTFETGDYLFTIKSIEPYHPEDTTKASAVVYKGTLKYRDKDRACNIWRNLSSTMLWQIGSDLIKLGVNRNEEVPDLDDADAVAELMQQFVGKTTMVHVRQYKDKNDTERNDFAIKGYPNGSALV